MHAAIAISKMAWGHSLTDIEPLMLRGTESLSRLPVAFQKKLTEWVEAKVQSG
uniref:Uncharacterized protein n=1 Tax=mine drainage metagenome TaxID=410659 RepID=E6QVL1_9ZZZZ